MTNCPPQLTLASRSVLRLLDTTEHWSRRRAWALSLLVCGLVLTIEHATPLRVSTIFLTMLATAFAVWLLGERGGLLLGLAAAFGGTAVKHFNVDPGMPPIGMVNEAWNTAARFGSSAGLALMVNGLRSALLLERWRASYDGLTGALNKMAFNQRMGEAIEEARAGGRSLVLAYMDLDGFKSVNDRHGHAAGDGVLRTFAGAAAQAIRASDLFARIGGDEFVALLSVRSCEEGDSVAAMLHERLTAILAGTGFAVTCSMGALVAEAGAMAIDGGVLELADMLMYEVKRSGKNALRIARGGRLAPALRVAYPPPAGPLDGDPTAWPDRGAGARAAARERRTAA